MQNHQIFGRTTAAILAFVWTALAYQAATCSTALARWRPRGEITAERIADAATCLVRKQGPKSYENRAPKYYRPEQMAEVGREILSSLKAQRWPRRHTAKRYVGLMLAYLYHQSKIRFDAVSRFNRVRICKRRGGVVRCKEGPRIWISDDCAGKHPRKRCRAKDWVLANLSHPFAEQLDVGAFQVHVSLAKRRFPDMDLADLVTIRGSLRVGAWWMAERAEACANYNRRTAKCPPNDWSVTCKCQRTLKATGGWGWAGSTPKLVRVYAPLMRQCFDDSAARVVQPQS